MSDTARQRPIRGAGAAATGPAPRPSENDAPLLRVVDLVTSFRRRSRAGGPPGDFRAVDGVGFELAPGRTLGLVGESGCGKTTVGRTILRLAPATSGAVLFRGVDLLALPARRLRTLRREMQMVFQDPGGSLDPRMPVGETVAEPLAVHGDGGGRRERALRAAALLEQCGMPPDSAARYPHEFSGGQRQRIAIARAIALSPALLILDEPTSALDVSVQAQVLNLLKDLQRDLGLAYLLITHDMAVVQHMCDDVAVMLAGRIVEKGPRDSVLRRPAHAYTRSLLAAVPEADPRARPTPITAPA